MFEDPLMEIRAALTTTSNADLITAGTTYGGVEVDKIADRIMQDNINRGVDIKPLIKRKPVLAGRTYFWNIKTDLGATTKVSVAYAEVTGVGIPYPSTRKQLGALVVPYRSDWEVTDFERAATAGSFDVMADEMKDAFDALNIAEEKMIICGPITGSYGIASSFLGLGSLMKWGYTNGGDVAAADADRMKNTTNIYGVARSATDVAALAFLDVSYVIAGTAAAATGVLELSHLNRAVTLSNKHGGKGANRIWFCSEERGDEIEALLQPQQRFAGTLMLEGGFSLATYKRIPIVRSRFMDKNGATNTTTWDEDTDADNAMYLLNLDVCEMRIMGGVDFSHVPTTGSSTTAANTGYAGPRYEVSGGFYKTYAVFCMKQFNSQVNICNLTAPAV